MLLIVETMEPITADCSLRFLIKSTDLRTWLTMASEFATELCSISEPFLAVCAVATPIHTRLQRLQSLHYYCVYDQ